MYLATPMDRFKYIKMPQHIILLKMIQHYNLQNHFVNNNILIQIERGMYGLPQSRILANKILKEKLALVGYYEVNHIPGMFKHKTLQIQFTLVVDDFGVKIINDEHTHHLIKTLQEHYELDMN